MPGTPWSLTATFVWTWSPDCPPCSERVCCTLHNPIPALLPHAGRSSRCSVTPCADWCVRRRRVSTLPTVPHAGRARRVDDPDRVYITISTARAPEFFVFFFSLFSPSLTACMPSARALLGYPRRRAVLMLIDDGACAGRDRLCRSRARAARGHPLHGHQPGPVKEPAAQDAAGLCTATSTLFESISRAVSSSITPYTRRVL